MNRLAVALCLAAAVQAAEHSERPRPAVTALDPALNAGTNRLARALCLAAAFPAAAQPERPRMSRPAVVALEQAFNAKIKNATPSDPMELMNWAQGVYIDGFGLVLVSEVDLISTPAPSPFRATPMTKVDIERVRARKLAHLPLLRRLMQETLLEAAGAAAALLPDERIVLAVSLSRLSWEDTQGLPAQIVMQAPRQKLLDRAAALTAIQVQEF